MAVRSVFERWKHCWICRDAPSYTVIPWKGLFELGRCSQGGDFEPWRHQLPSRKERG